MAYCLCGGRGRNVLCFVVAQPRPELRFAGPYVLQAPLALAPNVSSVFLTHDNHMHASSVSFMHVLDNMTTEELFQSVQDMERELGIPFQQRVVSSDMNGDSLVEYVKDTLIPKKTEVLEDKIQELDKISTQWQDLMHHLYAEEYKMDGKFQFEEFKPIFFKLVHETQTCIKSMTDKKGFVQSLFFGDKLGNKLVDSLCEINKRYNITRDWSDYHKAGVDILKSLRGLQTTQEEIIRQLTLESVHLEPHETIPPMLTTLIQDVQACANMLLNADVWNMEQRWMFEEYEESRKLDFWMLRSDSPIARFSKSLRALIEEMINVLMQQRRQELDTGAEGRHVWTHLLDTLKSFKFEVNIQPKHPQIANFGTTITFFDLTRKSNWTVWMRANGIGPKAIERLADLVTKMTGFCRFFIVILNGLNSNTYSWSKWKSKICQEYSDAMASSNVLDKLRKIE